MKRSLLSLLSLLVVLGSFVMSPSAGAQRVSDTRVSAILSQYEILVIGSGPAAADGYFYSLTQEEQQAVLLSLTNLTIVYEEVTVATAPMIVESEKGYFSLPCWTRSHQYNAYAAAGNRIFRYTQEVNWCAKYITLYDSRIASVSGYAYSSVSAPLWSFEGHLANGQRTAGGVGYTSATIFSQGKFKLFNLSGVAIQTRTPWIKQFVYSNGGYGTSVGG